MHMHESRQAPTRTSNGLRARRRWMQWVRRGLAAVLLLALLAVIVMAYRPKPVPVDVAQAEIGVLEVTLQEDGETRVKDRYVVSAPVHARLLRVTLQPGDDVKTGDLLARLAPSSAPLLDTRSHAEASARVAAARASRQQALTNVERLRTQIAFAEQDAKRKQALAGGGAVSARARELAELELSTLRKELASAEFGAKVAAHELEMARASLRGSESGGPDEDALWDLRSPVDGRVLKVMQRSEGVVQPGTPLLEVGDCRALEVVVDVLTADAVRLRRGADVRLHRWGGDQPLAAHVRHVEPSAFTVISALGIEEQRVHVIVDLDSPYDRWRALGDGYRMEAELQLHRREGVLRIPLGAAFREGPGWASYAVAEHTARLTPLTVGERNDRWIEVQDGLSADDTVVLFPSDRIEDGAAVEPR